MLKDARDMEGAGGGGGGDSPTEQAAPSHACSVTGCTGRYLARGYCIRHYYQVKRHGLVRADGECIRSPRPRQARQGLRPAPRRGRAQSGPPRFREHGCHESDCAEPVFTQGFCRLHYIVTRYHDLLA
jgi:hypothetical protein